MANPFRGEVALMLDGREHVARLTWARWPSWRPSWGQTG